MEEVVVHSLTRNYLKWQSHSAGIRPKAVRILMAGDCGRYERVTMTLNDFLLDGKTRESFRLLEFGVDGCLANWLLVSQLFEESISEEKVHAE